MIRYLYERGTLRENTDSTSRGKGRDQEQQTSCHPSKISPSTKHIKESRQSVDSQQRKLKES